MQHHFHSLRQDFGRYSGNDFISVLAKLFEDRAIPHHVLKCVNCLALAVRAVRIGHLAKMIKRVAHPCTTRLDGSDQVARGAVPLLKLPFRGKFIDFA